MCSMEIPGRVLGGMVLKGGGWGLLFYRYEAAY